MQPVLRKKNTLITKYCGHCCLDKDIDNFIPVKSKFFDDGYLPMCNDCIEVYLKENNFNWNAVNKLCQWADIPFIPNEFERLHKINGNKVFPIYAKVFLSEEFNGLDWNIYFEEFKKLEEQGTITEELPLISDKELETLKDKWGHNYDLESLKYLETLYNGLLMTQNINGALQQDQALKICKISLELDSRIRSGEDFDKMLTAYDKLVKTAEFTPKNAKNASDFDSVGELFRWLEKRGWRNKYYDDVTRDIVDETIKNIQNYNQRLYTNESGIGDEITRRIESLKTAKSLENYYDTDKEYNLDEYDSKGYEELMKEDFNPEV